MADGRIGPILETGWQMAVSRKGSVIEDGWQIAGKIQLLRPDGRWQDRSHP